jgi:hypothetical protein
MIHGVHELWHLLISINHLFVNQYLNFVKHLIYCPNLILNLCVKITQLTLEIFNYRRTVEFGHECVVFSVFILVELCKVPHGFIRGPWATLHDLVGWVQCVRRVWWALLLAIAAWAHLWLCLDFDRNIEQEIGKYLHDSLNEKSLYYLSLIFSF